MRAIKIIIVSLACALAAWAQPTPKFPAELPTWSDILRAKNSAVATLTAPIGSDDLSIPVSNGLAFAAPGAVTIDGEHIKICAVSANALTVCSGGRGFDGSQKSAHAAGKLVDGRVLARHHEELGAEVIALAESPGANLQNVVKNGGLVTPGAVPVVSAGGVMSDSGTAGSKLPPSTSDRPREAGEIAAGQESRPYRSRTVVQPYHSAYQRTNSIRAA